MAPPKLGTPRIVRGDIDEYHDRMWLVVNRFDEILAGAHTFAVACVYWRRLYKERNL